MVWRPVISILSHSLTQAAARITSTGVYYFFVIIVIIANELASAVFLYYCV